MLPRENVESGSGGIISERASAPRPGGLRFRPVPWTKPTRTFSWSQRVFSLGGKPRSPAAVAVEGPADASGHVSVTVGIEHADIRARPGFISAVISPAVAGRVFYHAGPVPAVAGGVIGRVAREER